MKVKVYGGDHSFLVGAMFFAYSVDAIANSGHLSKRPIYDSSNRLRRR